MYGAWLATGDLLVLMLAFDMGIPNILIQRIGAALAKSDKKAIGGYFGGNDENAHFSIPLVVGWVTIWFWR